MLSGQIEKNVAILSSIYKNSSSLVLGGLSKPILKCKVKE